MRPQELNKHAACQTTMAIALRSPDMPIVAFPSFKKNEK
jgi:hypothetical protein